MRRYRTKILAVGVTLALGLSGPARPSESSGLGPVPPSEATKAPVILLADLSSGQVLYAKNDERRFLPASMTKAMTALVAFDLIAAGKLREDTLITVRPETAARWSGKGTTLNLRPGEQVSVRDLLAGTMTVSANDAAAVLAEGALGSIPAWTAAMNARAKSLGMSGSHFASPNGLPDRGQTYVSAADLVRLAEALVSEHLVLYRRYIGHPRFAWRGQVLTSHDPFAGVLPGADGIKTGHTFEAGFNFLGSAERNGRRLVVVIAGAATEPGRAVVARSLVEWGFGDWLNQPWLERGMVIGAAQVQQGAEREVPLTVARSLRISVPRGLKGAVQTRILYAGPLIAPLQRGQTVARLEVTIPGLPRHYIPLVTARSVPRAGPIDRLRNGLLGLGT